MAINLKVLYQELSLFYLGCFVCKKILILPLPSRNDQKCLQTLSDVPWYKIIPLEGTDLDIIVVVVVRLYWWEQGRCSH